MARLLSPLRRMRPRVPFYDLAAHRIPTLWSLYRHLLKQAPSEDIKFRVQMLFRKYRHVTGTVATRQHLRQGYKWLEMFRQAGQGNERARTILSRYSKLIAVRREKEWWKEIARREIEWQQKLYFRPILTGGFFRPTHRNYPLPRMKPQPPEISRIIRNRRTARDKRVQKNLRLNTSLEDIRVEKNFEEGLEKLVGEPLSKVYSGQPFFEWSQPIKNTLHSVEACFKRDEQRAKTPYSPQMLHSIKQARREKVANKTRERNRERRGEILPRTIRRRNQGPPAHILAKMTPEQRKMDKIARSLSEVGYVAQVKRRLGFKLRNPEAYKVETGAPENAKMLDDMTNSFRAENSRRIARNDSNR